MFDVQADHDGSTQHEIIQIPRSGVLKVRGGGGKTINVGSTAQSAQTKKTDSSESFAPSGSSLLLLDGAAPVPGPGVGWVRKTVAPKSVATSKPESAPMPQADVIPDAPKPEPEPAPKTPSVGQDANPNGSKAKKRVLSGDTHILKRHKAVSNFTDVVIQHTSFQVRVPNNFAKFDKRSSCFVCLQALGDDKEEYGKCTTNVCVHGVLTSLCV